MRTKTAPSATNTQRVTAPIGPMLCILAWGCMWNPPALAGPAHCRPMSKRTVPETFSQAGRPVAAVPVARLLNAASPAEAESHPASANAEGQTKGGFRWSARRKEDRLEIRTEERRLVIEVHSPFGISAARVERTDAKWPGEVVVRLRLRGLESFRAQTKSCVLSVSVLSHSPHQCLTKLSVNGKAREIKPEGPTALKVERFQADGKPAEGLPGPGGWFDVHLPPIMLRDQPAELDLRWIDFYRG